MKEVAELQKNMAALLRKATVDEDYRRICTEDATKAYFELTGKDLPEKFQVRFCEPVGDENNTQTQPPLHPSNLEGIRMVCLPKFLPKSWLG